MYWCMACAGDARLTIPKDAPLSRDLFGRVAYAEDAHDLSIPSADNAAHLVRVTVAGVRAKLLAQSGRKDEPRGYHQTLSRTLSWASSSDWPQTPRLRYFQPPS